MAPFFFRLGGLLKRQVWFGERQQATHRAVRNRSPLTHGRPMLEALESRLCPSDLYNYAVVAKTGDTVPQAGTSGNAGTLLNASLASINDSGDVGFLGTYSAGPGVVEAAVGTNGSYTLSNLSLAPSSRTFTFPQITNRAYPITMVPGDVVAQDQIFLGGTFASFIRTWHTNGTFSSDATGSSTDTVLLPTVSPDGKQIAYIDLFSSTDTLYINGTPAHTFPAGSGGLRPMIANNGAVVYRDGSQTTSPIRVSQVGHTVVTIADSTSFSALGNNPGIGADGKVVGFSGTLTAAGAASLNAAQTTLGNQLGVEFDDLTPGPGIFVSIPFGGSRAILRLAGISGNETLDPGDTEINGVDVGPFSAFPDARVMPSSDLVDDGSGILNGTVAVAYEAMDSTSCVNQGIYTSRVEIGDDTDDETGDVAVVVRDPVQVVNSGDTISGVGQVTNPNVYAPITASSLYSAIAREAFPGNYRRGRTPSSP
jgi:hypothetical protein